MYRSVTYHVAMFLFLLAVSSAQEGIRPATTCPTGICFIQNTNGLGNYRQATASFNIDGTGTANVMNTVTTYQVGGVSILSIGSLADNNLFLGVGAGFSNLMGQNTANVMAGYHAGYNSTGSSNSFYGALAGSATTDATGDTFIGNNAGLNNTLGSANIFVGYRAGQNNTIGDFNLYLGVDAGLSNDVGSSNIYIGNPGSSGENNTIRIGFQGSNMGEENATYIAGIFGANVDGVPVQINSNGQLGTVSSSRRFKEQIRDMGDTSDALMQLRPVTFFYKPGYEKEPRTLQYGLVAEEVAQIYPDMVAYDKDGRPYTVKYQLLAPMLLNELQKERALVASQSKEIEGLKVQLQLQNASLQERLTRLEVTLEIKMKRASAIPAETPTGQQVDVR